MAKPDAESWEPFLASLKILARGVALSAPSLAAFALRVSHPAAAASGSLSPRRRSWERARERGFVSTLLLSFFPVIAEVSGSAVLHAAEISLVPEAAAPVIADRQDFQLPDRTRLNGWVGQRIEVNEANRLAKLDATRLLEGYRKRPGRQSWDGEHVGK